MSNPRPTTPDAARSRLRATLGTIEREISSLSSRTTDPGGAPPGALVASFADLVDQLALGPEPALRECPVCKGFGMRAATLCGYCWTKLTPPPEGEGVRR
jgi:hypothetical protein